MGVIVRKEWLLIGWVDINCFERIRGNDNMLER
jgi:hypothetical protein